MEWGMVEHGNVRGTVVARILYCSYPSVDVSIFESHLDQRCSVARLKHRVLIHGILRIAILRQVRALPIQVDARCWAMLGDAEA